MDRTKITTIACLSVVMLISLGCKSSRVNSGAEEQRAKPSVEFPYPNPFSPVFFMYIDVPDCMPVRVTALDADGDTLGVPLDSVLCGHLDLNWMEPRVSIDVHTGVPDTLYHPPQKGGFYWFYFEFPDTTIVSKQVYLR